MTATLAASDPLKCSVCGSDSIVLAYCAPVYVFAKSGQATRVVVADEEIEFRDRAWCRRCGDMLSTSEPELGDWPAWEVGW